jgi:hypothetical protein
MARDPVGAAEGGLRLPVKVRPPEGSNAPDSAGRMHMLQMHETSLSIGNRYRYVAASTAPRRPCALESIRWMTTRSISEWIWKPAILLFFKHRYAL